MLTKKSFASEKIVIKKKKIWEESYFIHNWYVSSLSNVCLRKKNSLICYTFKSFYLIVKDIQSDFQGKSVFHFFTLNESVTYYYLFNLLCQKNW